MLAAFGAEGATSTNKANIRGSSSVKVSPTAADAKREQGRRVGKSRQLFDLIELFHLMGFRIKLPTKR